MKEICEELLRIADDEIAKIVCKLPSDPIHASVILIEALRACDYNFIGSSFNDRIYSPDFYLIRTGLSLCISYLYKKSDIKAFPLMESTTESRSNVLSMILNFGGVVMLRRAADMVKSGLLNVEKSGNDYVFRRAGLVDAQHIDKVSFYALTKLEQEIEASVFYRKWNVVAQGEIPSVIQLPGNFISLSKVDEFKDFILENIDEKMQPHISPWDSGKGIMTGYTTSEEIDLHFLSKAYPLVMSWRADAGIHPSTDFKQFDGGELIAVVLLITSICLKHEYFVSLASQTYPEISVPQSLTTWFPYDEFQEGISAFLGMETSKVSDILSTITLKTDDVGFLRNNTSIFMPLLIDMENGFVVRPTSSILTNPFQSIISLMEYRDPQIRHIISQPREEWMRSEIYSLFLGERYVRVEGNIKLRQGGKVITDIDGAIYDKLTGELAIIQIKWQDFFINDVRKLRSKARNLRAGFDEWAIKIEKWINDNGLQALSDNLRLGNVVKSFYLFGISKTMSHTEGYGYHIDNQNIATSNMPAFVKCRFETGPTDNVIQQLFKKLKEFTMDIETVPMPFDYTVSNKHFLFEDLFCSLKKDSTNEHEG